MPSARAGAAVQSSDATSNASVSASLAIMSAHPNNVLSRVLHAFCGSLDPGKAAHSRQKGGNAMTNETTPVDRRLFVAGSALTLLGASTAALAQEEKPQVPKAGDSVAGK